MMADFLHSLTKLAALLMIATALTSVWHVGDASNRADRTNSGTIFASYPERAR
jgi:hypothetical protein